MPRLAVASSWTVGFFILLLSLAGPRTAVAQGWQAECPDCARHIGGDGIVGPYSTEQACKEEVRIEKSQGFPVGDCHFVGSSSRGEGAATPLATALVGGPLLGAGLGSLYKTPDGQTFWAGGAEWGGSFLIGVALLAHGKEISLPSAIVLGGLAGAAGGDGYYRYKLAQVKEDGTTDPAQIPEPEDEKKFSVKGAAIGAVSAATLDVLEELTGSEFRNLPPFFRALTHVRVKTTARRSTVMVSW